MKKLINKIIVSSFFVLSLFLINTNNVSAKVTTNNYTQSVSVSPLPTYNDDNLPMCDSTYRLYCPFDVRCRNINGMIAFACPAAYANQPVNTNYSNNNNYNNSYVNSNYYNNQNYNNYAYNTSNNAYYTNPVQHPYYDLAPTYNQADNYYYSY